MNNVSHKIQAFSLVFWTKNETFLFQNSIGKSAKCKGQAKPYQTRQFMELVERYALKLEKEDKE